PAASLTLPQRSDLPSTPLDFSSAAAPPLPVLHSFPTRRSSDLLSVYLRIPIDPANQSPPASRERAAKTVTEPRLRRWSTRLRSRSEEHTSELQSPDHLVCRLLLEKEKTSSENQVAALVAQRQAV